MPEDYTLIDIQPRDIVSVELTSQLSGKEDVGDVEAYRVRLAGGRENEPGRDDGELVFLPHLGRAGIAFAGEAIWTDASSADEAMERYLDHDILETDSGV
ncbi:MAG: hypothetical protein M3Y56_02655 [Armatimonadota bacterium]|nr:hypothetical protein [Armatimonadota bacterium]